MEISNTLFCKLTRSDCSVIKRSAHKTISRLDCKVLSSPVLPTHRNHWHNTICLGEPRRNQIQCWVSRSPSWRRSRGKISALCHQRWELFETAKFLKCRNKIQHKNRMKYLDVGNVVTTTDHATVLYHSVKSVQDLGLVFSHSWQVLQQSYL
jgi:hypothetical protein